MKMKLVETASGQQIILPPNAFISPADDVVLSEYHGDMSRDDIEALQLQARSNSIKADTIQALAKRNLNPDTPKGNNN